jgi:hypothetical protein
MKLPEEDTEGEGSHGMVVRISGPPWRCSRPLVQLGRTQGLQPPWEGGLLGICEDVTQSRGARIPAV